MRTIAQRCEPVEPLRVGLPPGPRWSTGAILLAAVLVAACAGGSGSTDAPPHDPTEGPGGATTPTTPPDVAAPSATVPSATPRPSTTAAWLDTAEASWSGGYDREAIRAKLQAVMLLFKPAAADTDDISTPRQPGVVVPAARPILTNAEYERAATTVHSVATAGGWPEMTLLECMHQEYFGGGFQLPFESLAKWCVGQDPSAYQPPGPMPSEEPTAALAAGTLVVTLPADGLRVRSQPRVGDDSIKYDPLLPPGTRLRVLDGPVVGSDYPWYRVALDEGVALLGGVREGWVAAADHDGTPWIATCPQVIEPSTLARLEPTIRPACFGGENITFVATVQAAAMDIDWGPMDVPEVFWETTTPDGHTIFLADRGTQGGFEWSTTLLLRVADASVLAAASDGLRASDGAGFPATISGHFADPASVRCRAAEAAEGYTDAAVVTFCRGALVVTEILAG